jgi:hypothetical protein
VYSLFVFSSESYEMTDLGIQGLLDLIKEQAAEIEAAKADAKRYRWLREQNADLDAGFYVGDETDKLPEDITWIGSDLDVVIDAAMSAKETP